MLPTFYAYIELQDNNGEYNLFAEVFPFPSSELNNIFPENILRRGMPKNVSQDVVQKLNCIVSNRADLLNEAGLEAAFPDEADEWIHEGESKVVFKDDDGKPVIITWPEFYPSWCSLDEVQLIEDNLVEQCGLTYKLMIDVMRSVEDALGEGSSRLIYWMT